MTVAYMFIIPDVLLIYLFAIFFFIVELSNMSFEEIMQLQNRMGTKAYNKIAYGSDKAKNKKRPDQMKRLNKHK